MKYYSILPILILLLNGVELKEKWVEPHAWGKIDVKYASGEGSGREDDHTISRSNLDERVSFVYYKKLILSFFNRNKFMHNEDTGVFKRALVLSVTETQLDMLEKSLDPRDLDSILSDIIPKIRESEVSCPRNPSFGFFTEMRLFFMGLSLPLELNFILIAIAFVLLAMYVHKKYNYGFIVTIISGFFVVGFILSYIDCNRKLKIEEMAAALYPEDDPCERFEPSMMWKFLNFFRKSSKKAQCLEYLERQNKPKLDYCRPDEVFLSYLNELIFNQFKLFIIKCVDVFQMCIERFSFPYAIAAMAIFGFMLIPFMKSVFEHIISPKNWRNTSSSGSRRRRSIEIEDDRRDRLSGENLRSLLNFLQHRTQPVVVIQNQPSLQNSGVEILENLPYVEEKNIHKQESLTENKEEKSEMLSLTDKEKSADS